MAQAYTVGSDETVQYTPVSAVDAGAVVVVGSRIGIAIQPIAASTLGTLCVDGTHKIVKDASVFTAGDECHWCATGDPVGGTADSGAMSSSPVSAVRGGTVTRDAVTGDTHVYVEINKAPNRVPVGTVAATGSTQADAAQIGEGLTVVTAADATKGVLLPVAAPGKQCIVKNASASILKVYPSTGDVVNALSANAAISIAANTCPIFTTADSTTWYTSPLLPS